MDNLTLIIKKSSLVEELKKSFTNNYPYLKIELYRKPANDNVAAVKKELLPPGLPLSSYIKEKEKTVIDIDNNVTVTELESQFSALGITVEIFRKSGNVWVETSLTNNWTLQQQNMEGEEISKHFSEKKTLASKRE